MAQSMAEQDVEVGLGDSPGDHGEPKVFSSDSMSTTRCSTLGTSDAGSFSNFKVPLYRDPANLGIILHFWTAGFVVTGSSAAINGVFAGYLNVPSYILNGALSLMGLPATFAVLLGALSDAKPIFGFHRRPYMAFGWLLIFVAVSLLVCLGLPDPYYCHTPDGTYLMDEDPCNPSARKSYVPLLSCFVLLSAGLVIANAAGDGLLVQVAKAEPAETRGQTQAMLLMFQICGQFCSSFVAAFGFNGRLFTGSFDQRDQLNFSQFMAIFLAPAAVTAVCCIFLIEEPKAQRCSLRTFWSDSFRLMEGKAFAAIATNLFLNSSIFSVKSNAGTWVSLQWAGVKMIQSQLASLLGLLFVALGTWLAQKYLLNVSWRKIIVIAGISIMVLDAIPQFLTIFNIYRDPYFYLGEPIAKQVPAAMMGLVTTLIANEVADDSNCALVMGMLKSISNIGAPLASLLSNQVFGAFHPSLTERENYIKDEESFRWTVAWSYLLSYIMCLGGLSLTWLLPSQKADAQRRKREWPYRTGYAIVACVVLLVSFLYVVVGDILLLNEEMACLRFLGGTGCG